MYRRQHAKLTLVDSGCFVAVQSGDSASQERWITSGKLSLALIFPFLFFELTQDGPTDWIDADLPIETQALLRHYMSKPVSRQDQEG